MNQVEFEKRVIYNHTTFKKTHVVMKKLLLPFAVLALYSIPARAQVCMPQFGFGCAFDQVNSFTVTGVTPTSISTLNTFCGTDDHEDFTFLSVTFSPGGTYPAIITSGTSTTDNVQVFIDFNDDDVFTNAETVGGMNTIADNSSTPSNFNITIPGTAATGSHTMRVIVCADGIYPNIVSCPVPSDQYGGGEVHDYTAFIGSTTPVCNTATNLTATGITDDAANFSWTAVVGAVDYRYVLNQTAADPLSPGTATTSTNYMASGLTSGTTYYFHLRTSCGGTIYSDWIDIPFTTLACPVPTGITESAITATSATVSWAAVTSAQGYRYAVTTSATPPLPGAYTTTVSLPVTGLTANTQYHTWVRTMCSGTDSSAWNAIHTFTTLAVSVIGVTGTNFTLQAYPNPAKNILTVSAIGKGNAAAILRLTDITGKLVESYNMTKEELNIDMTRLSSGIYFLRYADDAHRQTIKISKE
jgi:hypothetical protein